MASTAKPHPPKPMYPMYPVEHKQDKPKPKTDGGRVCFCFKKRTTEKVVTADRSPGRLEFCSVYGVPYLLLVHGIINSIVSPILVGLFWHECPALPLLIPVLLSRFFLGTLDVVGIFLLSAKAFDLSKSYNWVRVITDKVNWQILLGITLAMLFVWTICLFIASDIELFTGGKPPSYNPKIQPYCHEILYQYTSVHKKIIVVVLFLSVPILIVGSLILLCLLCIVSRF